MPTYVSKSHPCAVGGAGTVTSWPAPHFRFRFLVLLPHVSRSVTVVGVLTSTTPS
jgi:hypothetical protein